MTRYRIVLILLLANVFAVSVAQAQYKYQTAPAPTTGPAVAPKPPLASDPPIRQRAGMLVDLKGRGLYNYGGDENNKSKCSGQCILLWPPILAAPEGKPKGEFTLVTRDDGQRQWAFKGKPLYRWVS